MLCSLVALLPLLALAAASPIEKRYNGVYIVSGRDGKCLTAQTRNGAGEQVYTQDCNTAGTATWDINPGSGSVILHGSNLALDAGSNPGNNGGLKLWTSYPGLYQQTWYLTGDNRIAITGGNQCLDEGNNGPQTYQCTTGNTNQVWNIRASGQAATTTAAPATMTSAAAPAKSSAASSSGGGVQIHPNGDNSQCLSVLNGGVALGNEVAVYDCFSASDPYAYLQRFDVPAKGSSGAIKVHGQDYCLDAGSNPANGIKMKIWQCYSGVQQQTWTYSNDNKFSLSNNQCLDVVAGSGYTIHKPFPSNKDLQTYQCFAGNNNQVFTTSS